MEERLFEVAPNATWKALDGSIVVVDTVSGAYYSLNNSAATIWQDVVAGQRSESIVAHLLDLYKADPNVVLEDVDKCINYWMQEKLIIDSKAFHM